MLRRLFTHCMLRPADLPPTSDRFQVIGAFNPGVVATDDGIVLMVRVAEQPTETRHGYYPSPRLGLDGDGAADFTVDWLDERELEFFDPRVYHDHRTGLRRLRFISYFRVLRSSDGRTLDSFDGPAIMPEGLYEEYGIEDPRITRVGHTYYITYVAVSRHGVNTSLMSTTDFQQFHRHGIIFPPENKDVLLFPEQIAGDYVAMHRPVPSIRFQPPEMWLARSPDMVHWGMHEYLLGAESAWEKSRIGGGTPPIRTPRGWLTIYHGSQRREGDPGPGIYTAGAMLLDLQRPQRILAQSPSPIMAPEAEFEVKGFVREVVFPTAIVEQGETLLVYYGAADENTGVVGYDRAELLDALEWRAAL